MSKITTPPQSTPPLREYTLADLHALLAAIRSAIAAREDAEVRAAVPPVDASPIARPPERKPTVPSGQTPTPPPRDAPDTNPVAIETTHAPGVIKYMHPSNRSLTWTGDGVRPAWIDTYLAQGGSWIALQNTAEKLARR